MSKAHDHFNARNDGVGYYDDEMQVKPVRNYYGLDAWRPTGELRDNMRQLMRGVKYDTMIGTGISGSVFAARLAPVMGKDFAILRKDDDHSHMGRGLEGFVGDRWLFVDEFISTGSTLRTVRRYMTQHHPRVEFVGAYLYATGESRFRTVESLIERDLLERPKPKVVNPPDDFTTIKIKSRPTRAYYSDDPTIMRSEGPW